MMVHYTNNTEQSVTMIESNAIKMEQSVILQINMTINDMNNINQRDNHFAQSVRNHQMNDVPNVIQHIIVPEDVK